MISDDVLSQVVASYLPIQLLYNIRDIVPGWIYTFARRIQEPDAIDVLSSADDVESFQQIIPLISPKDLDTTTIERLLESMYKAQAMKMIQWMINNGYLEDVLTSIRYQDNLLLDPLVEDIVRGVLQSPDRVELFIYSILSNRDVFGNKFYLPIFEQLLIQGEITEDWIDLSSNIWLVRNLDFWKLYSRYLPLESFLEMLDIDDIHALSPAIATEMAFMVKDRLSQDTIKRILIEWRITQSPELDVHRQLRALC